MKRVLLALALLGLGAGMASAQVDDLTGGVFIAHHDPNIVYSEPLEGWCQHYIDGYAIGTCEEQNPSIMTGDRRIWFLLSAFSGDKQWCGTEFGFGQYEPYLYIFLTWGPCAPGGFLEIPTAGWPGPGEGTAIVTTDLPWDGNWLPVYYFTGYYYYFGPGQIPFDVDPPTGFAGWGNCLTPPESFDAACLPAMGILMDGVHCCPEVPRFVCCEGDICHIMSEQECMDIQGEWHPEWDSCDPNPCVEIPTGACCVGEVCHVVTAAECADMQGEYLGDGTDCGPPNPCEYFRAVCCVICDCYITTDFECADMGGIWHPEWDSCDPNPCDQQSPVDGTSWGTIKAIYR